MVENSPEFEYQDFIWTPPAKKSWFDGDFLVILQDASHYNNSRYKEILDKELNQWWEEDKSQIILALWPYLKEGWTIDYGPQSVDLPRFYKIKFSTGVQIYEDFNIGVVLGATALIFFIGGWVGGSLGGMMLGGLAFVGFLILYLVKLFHKIIKATPSAYILNLRRSLGNPKKLNGLDQFEPVFFGIHQSERGYDRIKVTQLGLFVFGSRKVGCTFLFDGDDTNNRIIDHQLKSGWDNKIFYPIEKGVVGDPLSYIQLLDNGPIQSSRASPKRAKPQ